MDRHVEFVTQLSHLVALNAQDPVDHTAEKAALRAARGAAKHGVVDLFVIDGELHAGHLDAAAVPPEIVALQALFIALGIKHIHVAHHAKQEEVKHLATLLGGVVATRMTRSEFRVALAVYPWTEVGIECESVNEESVAGPAARPPEVSVELPATASAPLPLPDAVSDVSPEIEPELTQHLLVADEGPAEVPDASGDVVSAELGLMSNAPPELAPTAEPERGPLAAALPDAVHTLVGPAHLPLFERLITSSEPSTLRRLLEPVQQAIEQTVREGSVAVSVHLLLAMFACEACAMDDEMRRQFVVTVRRLTKPTILRAYAMLYVDAPVCADDVEQALARFGEDGAEAVADRIGGAPTMAIRATYTELLARLPGTADALLSMLDDDRPSIVERAVNLMVQVGHPELERQLGELLGHTSARVRQAAARGLAAATASTFAGDALVRAVQDASPDVRVAAAVALQSRREARLAAPIAARIDDEPELEVQLALVAALGRIAAPEGVQKLIALSNPNERQRRRFMPALRLGAIEAMGEARTPAAMAALQKLLEDREKDVREAAARLYTRARRQTVAAGLAAATDP